MAPAQAAGSAVAQNRLRPLASRSFCRYEGSKGRQRPSATGAGHVHNNDSFIDEVTEEVRRDRLYALLRRYGWIGIALVALIVGGAAWREWQKSTKETDSQAFGDAVLGAMANDDHAARMKALEAIDAPGPRKAVLEMLAAAEALAERDKSAALERLAAVTADTSLPVSYRQLADLKAVIIAGASLPAADRDARLAALAAPGAPYRILALEQQAYVLVAADRKDEAITAFEAILQDAELTPGLKARATQMIVTLGGKVAA